MNAAPTDYCFVDQCILTDGVRVGFLYREMPEAGGPQPDSGWSIRGEVTSANAAELDARSIAWVPLADVLAVDDSWRDLIAAPPGSAFARSADSNDFEAVDPDASDEAP
jgi:hypothetical protein